LLVRECRAGARSGAALLKEESVGIQGGMGKAGRRAARQLRRRSGDAD